MKYGNFFAVFGRYFGILRLIGRLQCPHCALPLHHKLLKISFQIQTKQFIEVPLGWVAGAVGAASAYINKQGRARQGCPANIKSLNLETDNLSVIAAYLCELQ